MSVEVYQPDELDEQYWCALQGIAKVAITESLAEAGREQPEADARRLVGWENPEEYYASHLNPAVELGRRYNVNQAYSNPRVAVAFDAEGHRIGFAYSAHNVSGSSVERRVKFMMPSKRYLWLRDVVVMPENQKEHVAAEMIAELLKDDSTDQRQPVSTYIWPQLMPHIVPVLQRHGFEHLGTSTVRPFDTKEEVEQHRMVAPSAGFLLEQLRS